MGDTDCLLTGLPGLVDDDLRVLILGSFPREASLQCGQYYAHPRNQFWPIMAALFEIDRAWPYEKRMSTLSKLGLGLWDVIAQCRRKGSLDGAIRDAIANPLTEVIANKPKLRAIFFNGSKAEQTARALMPQLHSNATLTCERLPSTSPARATPFRQKVEAWAAVRKQLLEAA